MTSRWIWVVPVALLLELAAGARPAGGRTIGEIIDDTKVTAEVRAKLAADALSNLTKIDVKTESGVVTLSGTVDSAERRTRAAQIAGAVPGVKGLVNGIRVAGADPALATPGAATR
jgi:hyperosmotically inducible protein